MSIMHDITERVNIQLKTYLVNNKSFQENCKKGDDGFQLTTEKKKPFNIARTRKGDFHKKKTATYPKLR